MTVRAHVEERVILAVEVADLEWLAQQIERDEVAVLGQLGDGRYRVPAR